MLAENDKEDLIADLVAIVYRFTARLYGQRRAKRNALCWNWRQTLMNEGASLCTLAQLKERGWAPALVKKLLCTPDTTKPNPYYRSAAPMQFYALARVEACEQEDGWKQAEARAAARSLVGKTVAVRKAAELVAQAETVPITVRRLPLATLLWCAIASYNAFHEELLWERGHDCERGSRQSDPAFLERIAVKFIRHELTEYGEAQDATG